MGTIAAFWRLTRAAFVMAREGVFSLVPIAELRASERFAVRAARLLERRGVGREDAPTRLSEALNRLGPSYVKLGQFLSTRADVVGRQAAADLSHLRDAMAPFDRATAVAAVEAEFGVPLKVLFARFDEPIAAASIAQVHPAETIDRTGARQRVAVKVLRPNIAARFARDLESFYLAARLIERFHPPSRRLRPVAVVDTLAHSIRLEMDLRLEAAALSEMAENTASDPGFRVPEVDWLRTGKTVLSMSWIDGVKLSDRPAIDAAGIDREQLAACVVQSFLRHAVRDGFFHADMHQGNLFVDSQGTLIAVDFGIMGRLSRDERRFLAEILFGFITRDYRRIAEVHFEAGYVPPEQDVSTFAQMLRAIGEPIHGRDASEISMARLLTQLLEGTELFDMRTQPQLIMLQKTMVVVEGVARDLNPRLDLWTTAEPVIRPWIEARLGPAGRFDDLASATRALGRLVSDLPVLAERAERLSRALDDGARSSVGVETSRSEPRHDRLRTSCMPCWLALGAALVALLGATMWPGG